MRKIIIGTLLALASVQAVADEVIPVWKAEQDLRDRMESVLIVNEGIKDARIMALQVVSKMTSEIDFVIGDGLNNGASCEVIAAYIGKSGRDAIMARAKSEAGRQAGERLNSAEIVYTMAKCYQIKG